MTQDNLSKIISINGPIIYTRGFAVPVIGNMVEIGEQLKLTGEIIKIIDKKTIIQCYEETFGLELHDTVKDLGYPLSMELGPGILHQIFDGIQRPLQEIAKLSGSFIKRGIKTNSLSRTKKWKYNPLVSEKTKINSGDIIGYVEEYSTEHKIMVPNGISGTLIENSEKEITLNDDAFTIQTFMGEKLTFPLYQRWPIRKARPIKKRKLPNIPLITGTRVFDLLFPVAKGGCVAVPGGFGTGKTVVQHSLAKFSDAEIIIYIGCGERGNEIADLLEQFPKLKSPINNRPLMERTILIANTSNMPVSAREASIFSGITMAEYWRDQGKHVLLLADSTSRWAEALRELSGRLEEMPAEGGYPAYLSDRLSDFYERAGYSEVLGTPKREGSITTIGAVSPPGGDFSEPVTKNTKRFIRCFWGLDASLAYSRHYPSINWNDSYSLFDNLEVYWENIESDWSQYRGDVKYILSRADELKNISQLVGVENLPADQQLEIFTADLIKEGFLIQNAFDDVDCYSSPKKTMSIIKIILNFHTETNFLIKKGIPMFRIKQMDCIHTMKRMRLDISNDNVDEFNNVVQEIAKSFNNVKKQYQDFF